MVFLGLVQRLVRGVADIFRKGSFTHIVGTDLGRLDLRVNGNAVDKTALRREDAKGGISAYFTLKSGKNTYVFWDTPDAVQRDIQRGRKNHIDIGDGSKVMLDLREGLTGGNVRLKLGARAEQPPVTGTPVARADDAPRTLVPQWNAAVVAGAAALRETLATARAQRHAALVPAVA